MAKPHTSNGVATLIGFLVFAILWGILAYYDLWWPGFILAFGLGLAVRNTMIGRLFETILDLAIFLPLFIFDRFNIGTEVLVSLPVIFLICAVYIILREVYVGWRMVTKKDEISSDDPKHKK